MRFLAFVLLIGVALRHMGASWLAPVFGMPVAGMFYVLGGLWEVVLCAVVLLLLHQQPKSVWRNLAFSAAYIGVIEGSMIAGCRVMISDMSLVPKGMNLCDFVTGLPVAATLGAMYVLILAWGALRK